MEEKVKEYYKLDLEKNKIKKRLKEIETDQKELKKEISKNMNSDMREFGDFIVTLQRSFHKRFSSKNLPKEIKEDPRYQNDVESSSMKVEPIITNSEIESY